MITIWKTVLRPVDVQTIEVPFGAEMLCAREQSDQICVWYRCNSENSKQPRAIEIVGTGHPAPNAGRYLGTAALRGGQFMFHVWELGA